MRKATFSLFLIFVLATAACRQETPPPPDTRAADEAAIRAADAEWVKAAQAKDPDKWASFYAEDGAILPAGAPMAKGKAAVREVAAQLMALPGFALTFAPTLIEVARSGDLAYDVGTYELTTNNAKGEPVVEKGKYVVVWKKQADGGWKVAADIFNAGQ